MRLSLFKLWSKLFSRRKRQVVGIDISDHGIKFVEIETNKNLVRLLRWGEESLPAGIIYQGQIIDKNALDKILLELKNKYKFSKTKILAGSGDIREGGEALFNSLVVPVEPRRVIIVDLGQEETTFYLFQNRILAYYFSAPLGGEHLTRNIHRYAKLEIVEAEKMKRRQGLSRSSGNRLVFEAIVPALGAIRDELARINAYQLEDGSLVEANFSRIILTGGSALLPGLVEYLENSFDCPVELANPWDKIRLKKKSKKMSLEETLSYHLALSLAIR